MQSPKIMQSFRESEIDTNTHKNRETWGGRIEFTLSCIGYAIGFGNIWRFPYLCMRNGGGAFLIPYWIFLVLCGMPLLVLEMGLGQFSSAGAVTVWRFCPLFTGVGWAAVTLCLIVTTYYNALMAWTVYFLGMSLRRNLPWTSCDNSWNTEKCFSFADGPVNFTNVNNTRMNNSDISLANQNNSSRGLISSAEEFWHNKVLDLSDGVDNWGSIKWDNMLCLLVSCVLLFLCTIKGVKSSGKVVYVTATLPYFILTAILVKGVNLPGSLDGIRYFIIPDWEKLKDLTVWTEAGLQVFFSQGIGWGGIAMLAGHNKFSRNYVVDGVATSLIDGLTSMLAGFALFSVLGFMAHELGVSVDNVAASGPGLTFVVYPQAIGLLPLSPVWAVCFFLMLLSLSIDSQFVGVELLVNSLTDAMPRLLPKRMLLTAGVMVVIFLLGLPVVTRGGMYIYQLIDWYFAAFTIFIICIMECIVAIYVYGAGRLYYEMSMMVPKLNHYIWIVMCGFVSPLIIMALFVSSVFKLSPPYYGDYKYPPTAIAVGFAISLVSVIPIVAVAMYKLIRTRGNIYERFRQLIKPDPAWGPQLPENKECYRFAGDRSFTWRERFLIRGVNKSKKTLDDKLEPERVLLTHIEPKYPNGDVQL